MEKKTLADCCERERKHTKADGVKESSPTSSTVRGIQMRYSFTNIVSAK